MSESDKLIRLNVLNRARQKKYYDANSAKIKLAKQLIRNNKIRDIPLIPPPIIPPPSNIPPSKYDEDTILERITEFNPMNEATRRKKLSCVKILFNIYPTRSIVSSLNDFDGMKHRLENAHQVKNPELKYSPETMKVICQSILWIIANLNLPILKDVFKKYEHLVMVLKQKSIEHKIEHKKDVINAVLPYKEYLEDIRTIFGNDSTQYLIASLYNEITARDDFGGLVIVSSLSKASDASTNYLVISPSKNATIILNNYKTCGHYGRMVFPLSNGLTKLLRNYIIKNDLSTHLFPLNSKNGLTKKYLQ